jgi:hypothetical protein
MAMAKTPSLNASTRAVSRATVVAWTVLWRRSAVVAMP